MLPRSLVVRVGDHLRLPRALVLRVVDHRRLPLAILFVAPVVRLLGLRVGDLRGDVVVALRLDVLRIGDLLLVDPVLGLGHIRVLDLLREQEVPIVLEVARLDGLLVDEDLVGVVRADLERVHVAELVGLALDIVLDQQVLVLGRVVEDHVGLLRARAADIRPKHDGVLGVSAEAGLVHLGQELDVRSAAVDLLLVLHRVADDQVLVLVVKRSF
mmetsp:Transcript_10858/g.40678  ORF Transcript_10858/g.40678 Transcript_10858/m.40678 type:complete len:214 (-) Transcript_10858:337-978(-)